MYYYYWFAGQRLLEPADRGAAATATSTSRSASCGRTRTGPAAGTATPRTCSSAQDYDRVPAEEFIDDVAEFLADPRYMTIDGQQDPGRLPARTDAGLRRRSPAAGARWRGSAASASCSSCTSTSATACRGSTPPRNTAWTARWSSRRTTCSGGASTAGSCGMRDDFEGNAMSYPALADDAALRAARDIDPNHFPGRDGHLRQHRAAAADAATSGTAPTPTCSAAG